MKRAGLAILAGCALTSPSAPRELRYFAPALDAPNPTSRVPCARVRLGRVTASENLELPIVHRLSAAEVEPYETMRWTERPDVYARRALSRALFDARPLEEAVGGDLVLDVDLVAFEQSGRPGAATGRVELQFVLRDDRHVVVRGDARAERAASTLSIDAVVAAVGAALTAASSEVADRVVAATCPRR